jgi:hypothetical protein
VLIGVGTVAGSCPAHPRSCAYVSIVCRFTLVKNKYHLWKEIMLVLGFYGNELVVNVGSGGKEYFQRPLRLSNAFPHSYHQGHCPPLSVCCSCTVLLPFSSRCCAEERSGCETVSLSILASSSHHLYVASPIFFVPHPPLPLFICSFKVYYLFLSLASPLLAYQMMGPLWWPQFLLLRILSQQQRPWSQ